VLCSVSILARAYDKKLFDLDNDLASTAPEWKSSPYGSLKISDLLNHCAGLRDWYPFYEQKSWKKALLHQPQEFIQKAPRAGARYSDIGFLLLGTVVESLFKKPLREIFQEEVLKHFPQSNLSFGPVTQGSVMATEWRIEKNAPLTGETFDENASALGGIAPHAGLFGSAKSIAPLAKEWLKAYLGKSQWLSQETAQLFTKKTQWVEGSSWALGWDTRSSKGSSAGSLFSTQSFGHLGYTGTSLWIDPLVQGICIFLTNRVHPSRVDERIRRVRPVVHDLVFKMWSDKA